MTAVQRKQLKGGDESSSASKTNSTTKAQNNDDNEASSSSDSVKVNGKTSKERKIASPPTILEWSALALLVFLTFFLMPHPLHAEGEPSIQHVFYYGWLTAVSTGFGVVPLIFAPDLASYWVGISNGRFWLRFRELFVLFFLLFRENVPSAPG